MAGRNNGKYATFILEEKLQLLTVTGWRGGWEKQWEICYLHLRGETTVIDSNWTLMFMQRVAPPQSETAANVTN